MLFFFRVKVLKMKVWRSGRRLYKGTWRGCSFHPFSQGQCSSRPCFPDPHMPLPPFGQTSLSDTTRSVSPQRALLQKARSQPSPMLPLPVAAGCPAPALTEEMLLKREERARKRRLQAARRAEEHKNQTIERLTKTAAPSGRGGRGAARGERRGGRAVAPAPMVRYSSGAQGSTLSFPPGVPAPAPVSQRPCPSGPPPRCSVPGCPHPRRYACSRTGQALCSLQCYRINLQMRLGGPEGPGSPLLAT